MRKSVCALVRTAAAVAAAVSASAALASDTPWSIQVDLTAASTTSATMTLGLDAAGTTGLDVGLGEQDLPPGDTPFAAFPIPGTLKGSLSDYRALSPANALTWQIRLGTVSADYPIDLVWSLTSFPATGTIRIQDSGGSVFDVNMRATTTLQVSAATVHEIWVVYDPNATNLYSPPTVTNTIADQALTAGDPAATIDLATAPVFTDPDSDPLTYSAGTSDNTVATASVSGSTLSITPLAAGTATITVSAADPHDGVAQTTFAVTVTAAVVNVAPVVANAIADFSRRETAAATTRDLNASPRVFTDANGDALTYSASSSAAGVATASISGSVLTVTPVAPGTATITVSADDGTAAPVSTTFGVTIVDVTVATPFAMDLTVTNALAENTAMQIGLNAAATDGLDLGLGEEELPPLGSGFDARFEVEGLAGLAKDLRDNELVAPQVWTLKVEPDTGGQPIVLDWSPAQLPATGVIRLQDADGGNTIDINMRAFSTLSSPTVTDFAISYDAAATNLYNPPVVANAIADPAALTAGDAAYTLNVSTAPVFTDPDSDPLSYTASTDDPAVATASMAGSVLTVTPVAAGTAVITVNANDGKEGVTSTTFTVTVEAAQASLPPVVANAIANQTLIEGGTIFTRNLGTSPRVFTDPNGDALTYTTSSSDAAVASASISGSALTVTPLTGGTTTITVSADDGTEPPVSTTFSVTVLDVAVATPFTINLTVANSTANSQAMSFGLNASATGGLDAGLGEAELPPLGVGFDARFAVTGLNGLTDDLRFNELTAPQAWSLTVQAGTNGLPLTLTWNSAPLPATGTLRLQDTQGGGTLNVNMRARTSLSTSLTAFRLVYDATAVNNYDPPVVANAIADQALTAGDAAFVLDLATGPVFTDPNSDALTYGASSSSNTVAMAGVSGTTLTVTPIAAGTATITVSADDGNEGVTTTTFTVTVTAAQVSLPPVAANTIANQTLTDGGAAFTRDLNAAPAIFTDPNGDVLTYAASSGDNAVATASISGSTLTVTPAGPGTVTITVSADDGTEAPVSTTFDVTVLAVITADAFSLTLNVANAGSGAQALVLGMADGATDGIDASLSEVEAPPLPVTSVFDARLSVTGTLGSRRDLRGRQVTTAVTWSIAVQVGAGGQPLALTWDPAQLPAAGVIRLRDAFGGSSLDVNMRAQSSVSTQALTSFRVVYDASATNTYSPPVVANAIADQSLTAGEPAFTVDLTAAPVFTDPESDAMTYTVSSSDNAVATASLSGTTVTVTPVAAGTATVSVTANDGNEGRTTTTFTVTVAVAQTSLPPVVANALAAITRTETDPAFVRDLNAAPVVFSDPNGDALTYTASSSANTVATASISGSTLTVTPVGAGTATITINADDGTEPPVSTTFDITVLAVLTIAPFTVEVTVANAAAEAKTVTIGFAAGATTGIDAGLGETDLPPKPPNTVFDARLEFGNFGSLIDLRPATAASAVTFELALQSGSGGLPFTLSWDASGLPATGTMRMQDPLGGNSLNVNLRATTSTTISDAALSPLYLIYDPSAANTYNPPTEANAIAAQTLVAGNTAFTVDLEAAPAVFSDPDGDAMTYTAVTANNTIASVSQSGSTLTVTPLSVGQTTITVTADDGKEGTAQSSFTVTVDAPALNLAPVVTNALGDLDFVVGDAATDIDLASPAVFTDPNADALTLTASSSNAGAVTATLSATVLTVTPIAVGSATITVTADDGALTTDETFVVTVTPAGPEAEAFSLDLTVTDAGSETATLTLGLAAGATDGIDTGAGETERPPLPPAGIFDARFTGTGQGNGLALDLRGIAEGASWTLSFAPGGGGYPIELSWDASSLPASVALQMTDPFGGLLFSVDMRAQSSLSVTNAAVTGATITYTFVPPALNTTLPAGWSLVSLPVAVSDYSLTSLFPDATQAYTYSGSYQTVTTLDTCAGYWVRLGTGGTYNIPGTVVAHCSSNVTAGWNLVGVPWSGSDFGQIGQSPAGILISAFSWEGPRLYRQQLGAMGHGDGYWVHLTAPGTLMLDPPTGSPKPLAATTEWDGATLWARGDEMPDARAELQLGVEPDAVVALPPPAPFGVDARALVGGAESWQVPWSRESAVYPLRLQGGPLTLGWDVPAADEGHWSLAVDGGVTPLTGSGSMTVRARAVVELRDGGIVPEVYALESNYPNPFNPSTTIRYRLPQAGSVSLRIFDAAGQVVRVLDDGWRAAGTHTATWDGHNEAGFEVANGIYLYQLRAGGFVSVRKMMLMK